jgi:hypothetical protein
MSGPPEDLSPGELFLKLQERPRPSDVVPFPRRTESGKAVDNIRIAVLSGEDHDLARIEARKFVKTKYKLTDEDLKDPLVSAVQGDAVARELLAMACVQEKPAPGSEGHEREFYPRVFPDGPSVGKALGADEVAVLFSNYLLVQHKYGPFEKTIQSEPDVESNIMGALDALERDPEES